MDLDNIVRCRDCRHSGPRTKCKTSTCGLDGKPVALDMFINCQDHDEREDRPAQQKWQAARAAYVAYMKSGKWAGAITPDS